jgi:hypothetical protein
LPSRDVVDQRLVAQWSAGEGRIGFGTQADYDVHPVLASAAPPADGDADGMPDSWETTQGLDPQNSGDAVLDPDQDGYTNMDEYLNSLCGEE